MLKDKKTQGIRIFMGAAAGFFAVALVLTAPAFASVPVYGVPEWIRPTISGPMEAVWGEIGGKSATDQTEQTLRIVIKRLFPGITVEEIVIAGNDLSLVLEFAPPPPGGWNVNVRQPELLPELGALFSEDMGDASELLQAMIDPLPMGSLSWAGPAFQQLAVSLFAERLPGWSASLLFIQKDKGVIDVEVGFQAIPPVVVAYSPRISSLTLPRILQAEVTDSALEILSPLIGLPGSWVARHERAIGDMIAASLETKWASREMKGKVTVGITPDRIAPVDIRVESERYTLQAWAAVYIGADDRYPELGVHLGRKTKPFKDWELELYGEWVARTNDLEVESRWGARWSTWPDIWVGAEMAYPGEDIWYRAWLDEIFPGIYLRLRFSGSGDSVVAIGWRFEEYLSWELFYDSRDGDEISIRLLGNL